MAQEKTTTMADGTVSKVTALPEGCTLALFDSSGGVSKIDAQKFMELVRGSIQIGGRNLLKGTAVPITVIESGVKSYQFAKPLPKGSTCTVSFNIDWSGDEKPQAEIYIAERISGNIVDRDMFDLNSIKKGYNKVTFNSTKKEHILFGFFLRSGANVTISEAKVELGNIPTDWTPAPEDFGGGKIACYTDSYILPLASPLEVAHHSEERRAA